MSNGKLTLDDILNEYSSAGKKDVSADSSAYLGKQTDGFSHSEVDSIVAQVTAGAAEKRRHDDEIKRRKQVDYEIMSGDYERKFMPDELKTSDELASGDAADRSADTLLGVGEVSPSALQKQNNANLDSVQPSGDELFNSLMNDEYSRRMSKQALRSKRADEALSAAPVRNGSAGNGSAAGGKSKKEKSKRFFGKGVLESIREKQLIEQSDQDEFERKYGTPEAPLFVHDDSDDELFTHKHKLPFETFPEESRSLSEKLELEEEYNEKYKDPPGGREGAKLVRPHKIRTPEKSAGQSAATFAKPDPFGKYSSESDIESILEEYASKRKPSPVLSRSDTSPLKGFTDIFNKLMAKEEESGDTHGGELFESSKNLKRSVRSDTPPIERKTINDIDLKLSDKLIHDTSTIKLNKNAELDKLSALRERRSEKVQNFVLMGDEEENSEEENKQLEAPEELDDYEKLTDTSAIAEHISGQKSKLAVRLAVLLICFAATAFIAIANDSSSAILSSLAIIDKHSQPDVVLFINSVIGIMAGAAAYQTVANGMTKLLTMKADSDSLPAISLVISVLTSLVTIANSNMLRGSYVYIYVPVAIGALIFNTVGKMLIMSRTERSFRFVSGDNLRYALFMVEDETEAQDFTRGALTDFPALGAMQRTELITDFLKTSYAPDSTDRFCKIVTPIVTAASLLIGIIAGLLARVDHGSVGALCAGLSAASCCTAMCSCFSMMIITTLPMNRASRKYGEDGGAVLGFDCIDEFADANSILADASQLFPAGSVQLVNIKAFPDTSIDEAIVAAASLTSQSGSVLKSMFFDIIVGKTEMLNPVESYIYEDSLGLCGWINNKRVLLGSRELMVNHSIEGLPSPAKESEYTANNRIAVYLSISGQLSAMFIVEINPAYRVAEALHDLQRSHIAVMLRSVDAFLSVNRLAEMFGVSPSLFRLLPFRMHTRYEKLTEYTIRKSATLACTGKFSALAELIVGTNRLRSTISSGLILMAAEILLGILLTLTMTLLSSLGELTVTNALIYNAAFLAAYCLFQLFKKL